MCDARAGPPVVIPTQPFEKHDPPPVAKEKILCCGWRRDIRDILKQLDKQVAPGSELHMMSDTIPINERNAFLRAAGLDVRRELTNLRIVHFDGNTAMRRSLEALPIAEYDSCMIFADQAMETEMMHSDSHVGTRRLPGTSPRRDRAATRRSSRRCSSSARSSGSSCSARRASTRRRRGRRTSRRWP